MHMPPPRAKAFYRPIEAAIRWAGLLRYKQLILSAMLAPRHLPSRLECPRWDELRLCNDRIYDAIFDGDLPFGREGITQSDTSLFDSPDLTIRHVDLKHWMSQHYPEQRPGFLFLRRERITHPFISLETGQAMLAERLALQSTAEQYKRQLQELQEKHNSLLKQSTSLSVRHRAACDPWGVQCVGCSGQTGTWADADTATRAP